MTDSGVGLDCQDHEVPDDCHNNPSGCGDQEGRYPPHGLIVRHRDFRLQTRRLETVGSLSINEGAVLGSSAWWMPSDPSS